MKPTFLLVVSLLVLSLASARGQGSAFTYQGRLIDNSQPANGNYEMVFYLCDAPTTNGQFGNLGIVSVPVSNGLFTVTLDFGNGMFPGADRWLEITVKTNGAATFTTLSPRQKLTPTPYSITAGNLSGTLPASQLSGTVPLAQLPNTIVTNHQSGVNFSGTFSGDGAGLTSLPGSAANTNYTDSVLAGVRQISGAAGADVLWKLLNSNIVRIVYMGDSMSEFRAGWMSAPVAFHREMVARYGAAGSMFSGTPSTYAPVFPPFTMFPEGVAFGIGGSVVYDQMKSHSATVFANQVGVYWLAWPGGGSNRLVHFNGDPGLTYFTNTTYPGILLDGFAATPTVRYTNWYGYEQTNNVVAVNWMTGGTNIILGVEFLRTNGQGVVCVPWALSAATVLQLTNIGTNVLRQLFGMIQPDMVQYHDKTGTQEQTLDEWTNGLYQALTFARGTSTSNSVVVIGSPFEGREFFGGICTLQDQMERSVVGRISGAYYLDLASRFPSGDESDRLGLTEGLHPTPKGATIWAREMVKQLGLNYP
jgi:hypothetical protein